MKGGSLVVYLTSLLILIFSCTSSVAAEEVDWGTIEAKTIKVFYPGQSSWQFMKGKDHGTGGPPVKTMKKSCAACHVGKTGEYDINADQIISGELKKVKTKKPLEPQPLSGMPGFKDVEFQTAYDAENIYMRFQWQGSGASVADPSLAQDDKADRISVQIADKIKSFRDYGCFVTCHDDQEDMPKNRGEDVKLYGYYTRSKGEIKPQEKLDGYYSKGQFIDLWIASFEGTEVKTDDEYILQDRIDDDQNDLSATGSFEGGQYTVVITRKLSTGDAADIELLDGKAFSIGVAIHDNKNTGRKHYTSFPVSIGLSTAADISAQKL